MNTYANLFMISERKNYKKVETLKEADCYILNTCHIRKS